MQKGAVLTQQIKLSWLDIKLKQLMTLSLTKNRGGLQYHLLCPLAPKPSWPQGSLPAFPFASTPLSICLLSERCSDLHSLPCW